MSPYLYAEKIDAPLLIIHGKEDTNPGTNPIQSELLYQGLKGLGKTARLVIFPKEGHRFRYRESIMHMAWEIDGWLARYA